MNSKMMIFLIAEKPFMIIYEVIILLILQKMKKNLQNKKHLTRNSKKKLLNKVIVSFIRNTIEVRKHINFVQKSISEKFNSENHYG